MLAFIFKKQDESTGGVHLDISSGDTIRESLLSDIIIERG